MQKICPICLEIYDGREPIQFCPRRLCDNDVDLLEVDDQVVDVVVKLMAKGIGISEACAGHFYDEYFSPIIVFHAPQFDNEEAADENEYNVAFLEHLQGFIRDLNKHGIFEVGGIEVDETPQGTGYGFSLKPSEELFDPVTDIDVRKRISVQGEFLSFLYELANTYDPEAY